MGIRMRQGSVSTAPPVETIVVHSSTAAAKLAAAKGKGTAQDRTAYSNLVVSDAKSMGSYIFEKRTGHLKLF
jgi:hypothetical protein